MKLLRCYGYSRCSPERETLGDSVGWDGAAGSRVIGWTGGQGNACRGRAARWRPGNQWLLGLLPTPGLPEHEPVEGACDDGGEAVATVSCVVENLKLTARPPLG